MNMSCQRWAMQIDYMHFEPHPETPPHPPHPTCANRQFCPTPHRGNVLLLKSFTRETSQEDRSPLKAEGDPQSQCAAKAMSRGTKIMVVLSVLHFLPHYRHQPLPHTYPHPESPSPSDTISRPLPPPPFPPCIPFSYHSTFLHISYSGNVPIRHISIEWVIKPKYYQKKGHTSSLHHGDEQNLSTSSGGRGGDRQ
jgi:hypothetical protein